MSKLQWNKKSSKAWNEAWKTENIGNSLGAIGTGITGIVSAGINNAQIKDTSSEESEIESISDSTFSSGSFDNLLAQFDSNNMARTNYTANEVRGVSTGQMVGNTLSGIGSGAIAGAQIGGPWGCVCAGTRVITNNGKIVNIEDLTKEEGILGFDKKIVKNSIFAFKPIAFKECVKITFNNGLFLECSVDHPIYTAKQGRASRKTLNGVRKRIKEYSFIEAKDLKVGDNIGCVISVPYFGNKQLPNAYLIGMLIGDGSYGKNKPVRLFTGDKNTWEYIEKNDLGVCVSKDTCRYSKEFRTYRILGGCTLLKNLGIYGQTKLNKTLPHNIHKYNKESICDLLAGLFDTDGCVCYNENNPKNGRIEFSQSNLDLIKNIQEQLIKLGIYSYIQTSKPKKSYINNISVSSKENYKLIIKDKESVINFYNHIHLNISYKKQHLELFYKYKISKHSKNNLESGVRNCKIIKIENIGIKPIYNLQADDSHTYIANFIITHNSLAGGVIGLGSGLAGIFSGNKKAQNKAQQLNNDAQLANATYLNNFSNSVENTKNTMFNNSLLNIAKEGGKIYIKPENRGKFTALKKRTGKSATWFKEHGTPAQKKMAIFALNAAKWKHAYGGPLYELSGDWSNGLTFINEGGSHESNPFEGVQIGIDPLGVPNLVEEGEVIYNDYVFSNRLKPTKKQLENSGLNKKYENWTFAKIVEDVQKESSNNPIDFISQNTLEDMMITLTNMQEEIRNKNNKTNKFNDGGPFASREEELEADRIQAEEDARMNALSDVWANVIRLTNGLDVYREAPIAPITDSKKTFNWQPLGRYAPIVADTATLMHNIFNKPDYSNADRIEKAARAIPEGNFTPIGDYINLQPLDRNYYLNQLLASSRSTSRAIQNQGLNAGQAMAGLLSNQYNTNIGIGKTLMEMERENMNKGLQEAQFNRSTNQANAQMGLQALAMDQQKAQNVLAATQAAAQMREAIDAQRAAAISQNLSGLTEGLSGIGTEATQREWLQGLIDSGAIRDYRKSIRKNRGKLLTKKRK